MSTVDIVQPIDIYRLSDADRQVSHMRDDVELVIIDGVVRLVWIR